MPNAPKRRGRQALKDEERKKKLRTEKQQDAEDSDADEDASEDDEDEDSSLEEEEDAEQQELEWFALEGCEPEPGDAAAVARLIRRCQLPPWAPASSAAVLAERLTNTPEGRRFASVVKQGLPDDEEDEEEAEAGGDEAEAGVFSVLGIADLDAALGLRECLGDAAPDAPSLKLLVKARAQELPPELALPQLEALQAELAKAAPTRLLLISPACPAAEAGAAEEAVFAEDDILQTAAGLGGWKPLRPPSGGGEADADAWNYRACQLEPAKLPAAIEQLRQTVGGRLRPA